MASSGLPCSINSWACRESSRLASALGLGDLGGVSVISGEIGAGGVSPGGVLSDGVGNVDGGGAVRDGSGAGTTVTQPAMSRRIDPMRMVLKPRDNFFYSFQ